MRILILGGYGLIGMGLVRRLSRSGHEIVGLGRSPKKGERLFQQAEWIAADISSLVTPEAWTPYLEGIDAVINAAGALQDGARDNLPDIHERSIKALIKACENGGPAKFIQISAPGASATSSTAFYRTKAAADAAMKESALEWLVLRPGVVIAPAAYGGTALLRALAAFPLVQPLVFGDRPLQTVSQADLGEIVAKALDGDIAWRQDFDVIEHDTHTLAQTVGAYRRWLGFPPARFTVESPKWIASLIARTADFLGHLGWRSPLRSTALKVTSEGVAGDPAPVERIVGSRLSSLEETLASLPSTVQDRWFARLFLLMPLLVATLSLFWIASGAIGLARFSAATALLTENGIPRGLASFAVAAGSLVDIALGLSILIRRTAAMASGGMILVSLAYLAGGTFAVPHLWADPLGPLVKAVPAMVLALVAIICLEDR